MPIVVRKSAANIPRAALPDIAPCLEGRRSLLVSTVEQALGDRMPGVEGHPASLLDPFNGDLLTTFDHGNGAADGEISYYTIGAGPTYAFTGARPEIPYLAGTGANPFKHQHPQFAVDPVSGVIALGHQAFDSADTSRFYRLNRP